MTIALGSAACRPASTSDGVIQDLLFELDGVGNLDRLVDNRAQIGAGDPRSLSQEFEHDDLYRLIQAAGTGYGILEYSYDKIGNLESKTTGASADPALGLGDIDRGGSAGSSGRLGREPGDQPGPHALTGTASGRTLFYDDIGNVIGDGDTTYVRDALGQMIRADTGDGLSVHFRYDHSGRRVLKFVDGEPGSEVVYISPSEEIRGGGADIVYLLRRWAGGADSGLAVSGAGEQCADRCARGRVERRRSARYSTNSDPAVVFASVAENIEGVFHLDGSAYRVFRPGAPGNTLAAVEGGRWYWVHAHHQTTFTLSGLERASAPVSLQPGWNQVVVPGVGAQRIADVIAGTPGVEAIWQYRPDIGEWAGHTVGAPEWVQDKTTLTAGELLLVRASIAAQFEPPQPTGSVRFIHVDHLGSSSVVTDDKGSVVEELYYLPFGGLRHRVVANGNVAGVEYTFGGKERDSETDLLFFVTRYYDPTLATFLRVDGAALGDLAGGSARSDPIRTLTPETTQWSESIPMARSS